MPEIVKLNVTVQIEPEGVMSLEEARQVAREMTEAALNYSLPRGRFKPPFTKGTLTVQKVENPPPA